MFGFDKRAYFEADAGAERRVNIDFSDLKRTPNNQAQPQAQPQQPAPQHIPAAQPEPTAAEE